MSVAIKEQPGEYDKLSVKRFYVGGVVESVCLCGDKVQRDLGYDYMSYPHLNKPTNLHFYHSKEEESDGEWKELCGAEWTEQIVIRVTLEAVPSA